MCARAKWEFHALKLNSSKTVRLLTGTGSALPGEYGKEKCAQIHAMTLFGSYIEVGFMFWIRKFPENKITLNVAPSVGVFSLKKLHSKVDDRF